MNLNDAQNLAKQLMSQHGLSEKGWVFDFDRATRSFGTCNYTHKIITLSKKLTLLNEESRVRNTILHEIAHALTPGAGHGWKWKQVARSIGCDGERCYSRDNVVVPEGKYVGVCPNGHKVNRSRLTDRAMKGTCIKCCPRYNPAYKFIWSQNGVPVVKAVPFVVAVKAANPEIFNILKG